MPRAEDSGKFEDSMNQTVDDMGVSQNRGVTVFEGPDNKDPTIWGTILGSPIFGSPHINPALPYAIIPRV